jgi:AcrR family transcriptional regulator
MTKANSSRPQTRREREKALHRREILEAAERVFAEDGFDHATVEKVAREAEFSVGALYNFFQNKEVLWAEVITKFGQDFLETFREEIGAADGPLEAIETLIRLKLRYAQEHGALLRVIMDANPGGRIAPAAAIPRNCYRLYDAYIGEVSVLFKTAMAKGLLRKADPTYSALAVEGIISAFKASWTRRGVEPPLAEQVRLVRQHFLAPMQIQRRREET